MKDLHIHTIYSDGELDVEDIFKIIKEKRIDFCSITDHDTIIGNKKIIENDLHKKYKINFVSGIELSAKVNNGNCHILGYNIDVNNEYLSKKILELEEMERYNILLVIHYLKEHYHIQIDNLSLEAIFNKVGSVNNVEVSKLLVKLGYCQSVREAFDKYVLNAKRAIKKEKHEFSPYECINMIKKAGGIPVLAHNYQLKKSYNELKNYILDLKQHGLMGLECYHSGFSKDGINDSLKIARGFDLLITGGSDYHGVNIKPDIEIGSGKNGNLNIEELSIEKYLSKKLRY